ncbi:hypothetical protein F511_42088 [Dorcoceras hygrometricum]|uniref:Uncharacterized protein n=1 Tax=Dorcoceras hygrometricum TaxID=472368 RepID=A0A2Z7AD56_9LAMI|nr:hypothetical protein F511_42088 [Dorcoceras hygrometricum]
MIYVLQVIQLDRVEPQLEDPRSEPVIVLCIDILSQGMSCADSICGDLYLILVACVGDPDPAPRSGSGRTRNREPGGDQYEKLSTYYDIHRMFSMLPRWHLCLAPTVITIIRLFSVDCGRLSPIRSTTRSETPSSGCTRSADEIGTNGFSSESWPETIFPAKTAAAAVA